MAVTTYTSHTLRTFLRTIAQKLLSVAYVGEDVGILNDIYHIGTLNDYNEQQTRRYPFLVIEYPTINYPKHRNPRAEIDLRMYLFVTDDPSSGSGNTYFGAAKQSEPTKIYDQLLEWYTGMIEGMDETAYGNNIIAYFNGAMKFTPKGQIGEDAAYCMQLDASMIMHPHTHGGQTQTP